MNLKPELLRGVYAYGFERPSAIQQRESRLTTLSGALLTKPAGAIMPVIKGMASDLLRKSLKLD